MSKYLIVLLAFILFACSSSEETTKTGDGLAGQMEEPPAEEIDVDFDKVYCWVNMMPMAETKFHITGHLTIPVSEKYDAKSIALKRIKIIQDGRTIYYIRPTVRDKVSEPGSDEREMLFSTIRGLRVDTRLDLDEDVDVEFIFEENGKNFSDVEDDVTIEKVH